MHFAASHEQADAMKLLESHGARTDVQDKYEKTPKQVLEYGYEAAKLLLQKKTFHPYAGKS